MLILYLPHFPEAHPLSGLGYIGVPTMQGAWDWGIESMECLVVWLHGCVVRSVLVGFWEGLVGCG